MGWMEGMKLTFDLVHENFWVEKYGHTRPIYLVAVGAQEIVSSRVCCRKILLLDQVFPAEP